MPAASAATHPCGSTGVRTAHRIGQRV